MRILLDALSFAHRIQILLHGLVASFYSTIMAEAQRNGEEHKDARKDGDFLLLHSSCPDWIVGSCWASVTCLNVFLIASSRRSVRARTTD